MGETNKTKKELLEELQQLHEKLEGQEGFSEEQLAAALQSGKTRLLSLADDLAGYGTGGRWEGDGAALSPSPDLFRPGVVLVCGNARLPASLSQGNQNALLTVDMALDQRGGRVVGVNCAGVSVLGQQLLVEAVATEGLSAALAAGIAAVEERYFGENKRAFVAAIQDVQKKYEQVARASERRNVNGTDLVPSFLAGHAPEDGDEIVRKLEAIDATNAADTLTMRNMLGVITGLASAMKKGLPGGSNLGRDLDGMLEAAYRCADVAERGSDSQAGTAGLASISASLDDLPRTLSDEVQSGVTLSVEKAEESLWVAASPRALQAALTELVDNARAAAGAACSVRITTEPLVITSEDAEPGGLAPGEYVQIAVQDDGVGISCAPVSRAFEPLYTSSPSQTKLGLGLSRVFAFAKRRGGSVSIVSEPGEGTTVFVMLPRASEAATESKREGVANALTVLLIDDEVAVRTMGSLLLDALGYRVLLAENGEQGLERFRLNRSDLAAVILDIAMPVMAGGECLIELKRIDPLVPVIISSGLTNKKQSRKLEESGADAFLDKPFDIEGMERALSDVLASRRQAS